jgi:hypothetical protein
MIVVEGERGCGGLLRSMQKMLIIGEGWWGKRSYSC